MRLKIIFSVFFLLLTSTMVQAEVINVSCTDSVKSLNKSNVSSFSVVCPVNCSQGSVWGTDIYTTDSAICVASVHAGLITASGGTIEVKLAPGQASYSGTTRNGLTTGSWGSYEQSFTVSSSQNSVGASSGGASTLGFSKGESVSVEWHGKWWPAKVIDIKPNSWKIHYDGYDNSWDEWVGATRIKKK